MKQHDNSPSALEPGTVQREQLRSRLVDIAGTALAVVLALWTAWSVLGVIRGGANAWIHCGVATALLAAVLFLRRSAARRSSGQPEGPGLGIF
ncbi:hypothetical protein [Streptomyces sp. NPDC055287]